MGRQVVFLGPISLAWEEQMEKMNLGLSSQPSEEHKVSEDLGVFSQPGFSRARVKVGEKGLGVEDCPRKREGED